VACAVPRAFPTPLQVSAENTAKAMDWLLKLHRNSGLSALFARAVPISFQSLRHSEFQCLCRHESRFFFFGSLLWPLFCLFGVVSLVAVMSRIENSPLLV
jgi:hypothetical protein